MPLPVHWVNHRKDASLSVLDRGFAYGDGLFETLRCHRGRFHLLDQHLQRLQLGCERLDIPCPQVSLQQHFRTAADYLQKHNVSDATLRLSVTRGSALDTLQGRGYAGAHGAPNVVLSLTPCRLPWRQAPAAARLIRYRTPLATQPLLAGIKHCNRLEQVLAAKAVQREQADEAILFDQGGQPVSAVAANLLHEIREDSCGGHNINQGRVGGRRGRTRRLAACIATCRKNDAGERDEQQRGESISCINPSPFFTAHQWGSFPRCRPDGACWRKGR